MSAGGMESFPVYSLTIAEMITINVEEKVELGSTRGAINVVAQPILNVVSATIISVNMIHNIKKVFTFFDVQKNLLNNIVQYRLTFWGCFSINCSQKLFELSGIEFAILPALNFCSFK
jgi:hypothetical protein